MINWEYYNLKIDNSARLQFNRYFDDIKLILENHNLSLKEHELFVDLEDHIIDTIRNKNITTISFKDAMEIIKELGPPDEFTDFSNLPDLVEEINSSKTKNDLVDNQFNELILCNNCNYKNETNSIYCIQCGFPIRNKQEITLGKVRNPFSHVLHVNPEYFFGLLTYFLLEILILNSLLLNSQPYYQLIKILQDVIISNEFIVVPLIFIYRLMKIDFTRKELALFLSTYLLKIFTMLSLVAIPLILGYNIVTWITVILISVIFISYPIVLTKLLFFTNYSLPINLNRVLNNKSKVGYIISTVILMISAIIVYFNPNDLGIQASFVLYFSIFGLYVGFDFVISFLLFNEKIIKTGDNSKISYGMNYITEIPMHISSLSDKIQILLLFCNIGLILLFINAVYLHVLNSMSVDYLTLFSIFSFAFILVDLYYDFAYHKSSNILLLTLGIYYLDFAMLYTYMSYRGGLFVSGAVVNFPIDYNYGLPLILIVFILTTSVLFPVLSVLVFRNKIIKDINEFPIPNNKITNVILVCCYFLLIVLTVDNYNSSIYFAYFTRFSFIFGLSVLVLIKPFFNLINYFMIYKFNIRQNPSRLVRQ